MYSARFFPNFLVLSWALNVLPLAGAPVESASKVTSEPAKTSEAPPPQVIAETLLPRPVWQSYYYAGLLIRCNEPDEVLSNSQLRLRDFQTELTDWQPEITVILSLPRNQQEVLITQFTSLCHRCRCSEENELIPGDQQTCDQTIATLCRFFLGCICEVAVTPRPTATEINIFEYVARMARLDGRPSSFNAGGGGPRQALPGRLNLGGGQGSGPLAPAYAELVPGTKEPYYLYGPGRDPTWDSLLNGNFAGGGSNLFGSFGEPKGSGIIWKRDKADTEVRSVDSGIDSENFQTGAKQEGSIAIPNQAKNDGDKDDDPVAETE
ncbi:hypothetical protein TWF281_004367 [Arthrobotrys megalospora]